MRKSTIVTLLCALWMVAGTTSHAATITVFHGAKSETFDTAKTPADGVRIVRAAVAQASKPSAVATNRNTQYRVVKTNLVAGDTLCRRDARTGKLVACMVGSSGMVGRNVIRCTSVRQIRR